MGQANTITTIEQLAVWVRELGWNYDIAREAPVGIELRNPVSLYNEHNIRAPLQHIGEAAMPTGAPPEFARYPDNDVYRFELNDENLWVVRESMRYMAGVYAKPGCTNLLRGVRSELWWHFPHVSLEEPDMIAYTPSHEYGKRDRQVRLKVGRYLTKYFANVLTPEQIRACTSMCKTRVIRWAVSADDMVYVYENGPSSCMGGGDDDFGGTHPVRAYATGDFKLAYLTSGEEDGAPILARGFVHESTKKWVRMYGDDGQVLADMLCELGYGRSSTWSGCELAKVTNRHGDFVFPYIDGGAQYVYDNGHKFVITRDEEDAEWLCNNTDGSADEVDRSGLTTCPECGDDEVDEDELVCVGRFEDYYVCPRCVDHHYTFARISSWGRWDSYRYLRNDETVEIDGETYVRDPDVLESYGFVECPVSNEWVHVDDTVEVHEESTYGGESVHYDCVWTVGDDGNGDAIHLTVDDLSDNMFVQRVDDDSFRAYPRRYVLSDPEMLQAWADNPDMLMPILDAIRTGYINPMKMCLVDAEGRRHSRGDGSYAWRMNGIALAAGFTPHELTDPNWRGQRHIPHTSYHGAPFTAVLAGSTYPHATDLLIVDEKWLAAVRWATDAVGESDRLMARLGDTVRVDNNALMPIIMQRLSTFA